VQADVAPTGREHLGVYEPFRDGTRVYVTLPDGRAPASRSPPQRHDISGLTYYTPAFVADGRREWALKSADAKLTLAGTRLYDLKTGRAYNPGSGDHAGPQYALLGPDGTTYRSTRRAASSSRPSRRA
jgi:hypothetical protein